MKKALACLLAVLLTLSLSVCAASAEETADREEATEYVFALSDGEERVVENTLFREDVTVSGNYAYIQFINCEFLGDVINTADAGTAVHFDACTQVDGVCYLRNNTKEATIDSALPKFLTEIPIEVVCEDCAGNIVVFTDVEIIRNGVSYSMANAEYYYDSEAGLVPYEGQEYSCMWVAQWWENGEKVDIFCCE